MQSFLSIALILSTVFQTCAAINGTILSLTTATPNVTAGQSAQFTCTVANYTSDYVWKWYRKGHYANLTMTWIALSVNDISNFDFLDYTFNHLDRGNGVMDLYMYISGAKFYDTGYFACSLEKTNASLQMNQTFVPFAVNKTIQFTVIVTPYSVKMELDSSDVLLNSSRYLELGSHHLLDCFVNSSSPVSVEIWHGNQNLTSLITSKTMSSPEYNLVIGRDNPDFTSASQVTRFSINRWVIDLTYLDVPVMCIARAVGGYSTISAQFYPRIQNGVPHFNCKDVFVPPYWANQTYDIVCTIYAKPPLTWAAFAFGCERATNCTEFTAFPPNQWYPHETVFSGIVKNTDTHNLMSPNIMMGNMTLRIRSIDRSALIREKRKFQFRATNDMGRAVHQVLIVDEASRTMTTWSMLLFSALSLVLKNNWL